MNETKWYWITNERQWKSFLKKIPASFISPECPEPINDYPFGVICETSVGLLTYILPKEIKKFNKLMEK